VRTGEPEAIRVSRRRSRRDKLNLDAFGMKDKSLEDAESLPEPDLLAQEIAGDLQTTLEQFSAIAAEVKE
jgi:type I restriction enzyme M protein